jgi:SAM-dependent methyltransferase
MDFWKLMDVIHKRQPIMNPMRSVKLDRFIEFLDLPHGSRVLDVGCGKGEFLLRLNKHYSISGIGIDKSPYCVSDCNANKEARAPEADIEFLIMDAADFKTGEQFDLTCCMGASWIYGGIKGTLEALDGLTKPGGLIVAGEPYWLKEPSPEYLKAEEMERKTFHTHMENVLMGDEFGLTCSYTLVSDHEDWDHYEAPHWRSASEYVDANPDDPDNPEILEHLKKYREIYLRWGRDTMGWCIYLYRKRA